MLLKRIFIYFAVSSSISLFLLTAYILQPPPTGKLTEVSQVLRSQEGRIINLRLTKEGYWREKADLNEIDPNLINVLVAYEDQRFWTHHGVDPLAVVRAIYDFVRTGRVSSGASTITMQTVRLINPRLARQNLYTKFMQMLAAIRLESHWSKEEILEAYFTLAPYGGNIEGIVAATEAWFQKRPKNLTLNEIGLLVALPQSPEKRRPDKFPEAAHLAKRTVIAKVKNRLNIENDTASETIDEPLPSRLSKPSSIAPHLADYMGNISLQSTKTTINDEWQEQIWNIVRREVMKHPAPIQGASMIVERRTGNVRAYVGSSDYNSVERKGANNYLMSNRSPGSTLKPIIYGKALQRKVISMNQTFDDLEFFRRGYTPSNFDNSYSGKVTLRDALLKSLNIPALITLEKLGPNIFENEISTFLGNWHQDYQSTGLSLAVGGYYLTAHQLIRVYLASIDPGYTNNLEFEVTKKKIRQTIDTSLLNEEAAEKVLNLLIQDLPNGDRVAFKTGTSYARQDAWSIQIFENHIVLAWFGTPDNQDTKTLTGRDIAFPVTHEIGVALGLKPPKISKSQINEEKHSVTQQNVCGTLINYPEHGTWIRSNNSLLSVVGSNEADWYLNSEKIGKYQKQIKLLRPGIHKLTAKNGNCSQTSEIFFEFVE